MGAPNQSADVTLQGVSGTYGDTGGTYFVSAATETNSDINGEDIEAEVKDDVTSETVYTLELLLKHDTDTDTPDAAYLEVSVPANATMGTGSFRANLNLYGAQANLASDLLTLKVLDEAPDPDPVVFKVTGTPSLTDDFIVTFTSSEGAELTIGDIAVTNGFVDNLRMATAGDNKVWKAVVDPDPGAKEVSVGIAASSTTVKADPEMGMISTKGPAAPTGFAAVADGSMVTFTWNASSSATHYIITQSGQAATTYMVKAPLTTFRTSDALDSGAYKFAVAAKNAEGTGPATKEVSVSIPGVAEPTGKTTVIDIPTQYDSSAPITLGSQFQNTMIPAHGWAVLVRDVTDSKTYAPRPQGTQGAKWIRSVSTRLPDLALFFGGRGGINSGTISLHAPKKIKKVAEDKRAAGDILVDDIVISEIMWGVDASMSDPTRSQWIEFYNTTTKDIDLTGWTITFHRSLVDQRTWDNDYLVDIASNAGVTDRFPVHKYHAPWTPKGQSGRSGYGNTNVNVTGVNIVSMYLDINYTQADDKTHIVDSGADEVNWRESVYPQSNLPFGIIGTPGTATTLRIKYAETLISQKLIINEIGNSDNDAYDWVEIYNDGDAEESIKDWKLTTVTDVRAKGAAEPVGKEEVLFTFPDQKIPAKSYVVFAASDPKNIGNDLAAGIDITKGDIDQPNKGLGSKDPAKQGIKNREPNKTAFYRVHGVKLPNSTVKRLYILRTDGHIGSDPKAQGNVVDVIGSLAIPLSNRTPKNWTGANEEERGLTDTGSASARRIFDTTLWPIQWGRIDSPRDGLVKKHPHAERVDGKAEALKGSQVYQRHEKHLPNTKNHLTTAGYTGIGYDRHAPVNAENGGTPGYANGALKGEKSDWAGQVTISEIMLATEEAGDKGRLPRATRLPQWFEIYNNSLTEGVNLKDWYLEIQNTSRISENPKVGDYLGNLHAQLRLPAVNIAPNQTVLVVAASGLNSGHFPEQRVINLFTNSTYRAELGIRNRGEPFLNAAGFYIQLRDPKNNPVDEIGNLGISHRDSRTGIGRRDETVDTWNSPSLHDDIGHRTSFIRIYDENNKGMARSGLLKVAEMESEMKGGDPNVGWRRAADVLTMGFNRIPNLTFYGNHEDRGTPGYRGGGPLPVSLSKFRPERLKETGEVVIRWITESETNNAGFNILRSETRDGEFTKVNTQLIAGHGTTSERNTYEWKDTTAKPNVVYYYQIQDVSLDGRVTTLRVNRLKGNVNAAGKFTTTWGELKALQ